MKREELFDVLGDISPEYVAEAAQKPRTGWGGWAALAACLCLVALAAAWPVMGASTPQTPEAEAADGAPSAVVEDVTYIISPYLEHSDSLPAGFAYGGSCRVAGQEWDYYTSEAQPLWLYVYQEVYDNVAQQSEMRYVRYVHSRIRGVDYISWEGRLYVSMWSADGSLSDTRFDQVRQQYGIRIEGEAPAGFASLGRAEFTGHDTLPTAPLGCNTGSPEVWCCAVDESILLASTDWYTAPDENGEQHHTGYNVYVQCEWPEIN